MSYRGGTYEKVTMDEALDLIKDGDTVAVSGFLYVCYPQEIITKLGERIKAGNGPKDLTLIHVAGMGNNVDRGLTEISFEGTVKRYVSGHLSNNQNMIKLINENKVEAWNFPQGVVCKLYRVRSEGMPGLLSKIGLETYVDPRQEGGRLNEVTKDELVKLVEIEGEEFLFYKTPDIDIAIIRGTTADEHGNITMEDESSFIDTRELAMAAHASGGKVIVQVKNFVSSKSLDRSKVIIPGVFVDAVVVSENPYELHRQSPGTFCSPIISGQNQMDMAAAKPVEMNQRKIIPRRAALDLKPNSVVNMGIGIPEVVGNVAGEEGVGDELVMTIESGLIGGVPLGGADFGSAANAWGALTMPAQFDYYDGNGLDVTYLGFAEVDPKGNINVSKFGERIAGAGGFIDISQATKNIYFCGTLTAGGLKTHIEDGKLVIDQEGRSKKFLKEIEQISYSAEFGLKHDQNCVFITERCVMIPTEKGLMITEIAPGIDLQSQIINQMEFEPLVSENLKEMDSRIFAEGLMGLREEMKSCD